MNLAELTLDELTGLITDLQALADAGQMLRDNVGMDVLFDVSVPGPWQITVPNAYREDRAKEPDPIPDVVTEYPMEAPPVIVEPDPPVEESPEEPEPELEVAEAAPEAVEVSEHPTEVAGEADRILDAMEAVATSVLSAVEEPSEPAKPTEPGDSNGLLWEAQEDEAIIQGRVAGEAFSAIAAQLGRTEGSTRLRAHTHLKDRMAEAKAEAPPAPSLLAGRGRSWTEKEEEELIERWIEARSSGKAQTTCIRAFAEKTGRTEMAVQQRIKDMKIRIHEALTKHFKKQEAAEKAAAGPSSGENDIVAALRRSDLSEKAIGQIATRYRLTYDKVREIADTIGKLGAE